MFPSVSVDIVSLCNIYWIEFSAFDCFRHLKEGGADDLGQSFVTQFFCNGYLQIKFVRFFSTPKKYNSVAIMTGIIHL